MTFQANSVMYDSLHLGKGLALYYFLIEPYRNEDIM